MSSEDRFARLQERYKALSARLLGDNTTNSDHQRRSQTKTARPKSSLDVHGRASRSEDEHNRRLKLIHNHMWQHRQEGRDMKRAEVEMKKTQTQLKKTIQCLEKEAEKKKREEDFAFHTKQLALAKYEQQDLRSRKAATEAKIRATKDAHRERNLESQKHSKAQEHDEFVYQTLCQSLDVKQAEVQRLTKEFEEKIRRKEEEQFELQKRLADVAISVNMEASKRRQQVADETRQRSKQVMKELQEKADKDEALDKERKRVALAEAQNENNKRKLAKELRRQRELLTTQVRETARQLSGVQTLMQKNTDMQLRVQEASDHVNAEQQLRQSEEKVQMVDAKHQSLVKAKQRESQTRNLKEQFEWEKRMTERQIEVKRKEHEDKMKHLTRVVQKQEDLERALYERVREAELARRKQDDIISQLQADLDTKKRENARQLKELAVQTQKVEEDMKQRIIRETAELSKAINEKQEGLKMLTQSRFRTQEERYMLEEEKREHERVKRIEMLTLVQQTHQ